MVATCHSQVGNLPLGEQPTAVCRWERLPSQSRLFRVPVHLGKVDFRCGGLVFLFVLKRVAMGVTTWSFTPHCDGGNT